MENLPENKIYEMVDFIDFLSNKHHEEMELRKGIEKMVSQSDSFSFLDDEDDIYEEKDLIEKY